MFSYIFKYRWIQPISKLLSLTLTSPDRKTSRPAEQRWEDKNTCTFPLTKKLLGLRKEPQAYIQSRPHKVRYHSMQQKRLLINLYYFIFYIFNYIIYIFLFVAFIICWYIEPTMPEQAASITEKLGDYLIQVGY